MISPTPIKGYAYGAIAALRNLPEDWLAVPLLKLVLKYYLHSSDRTAIVFAIDQV